MRGAALRCSVGRVASRSRARQAARACLPSTAVVAPYAGWRSRPGDRRARAGPPPAARVGRGRAAGRVVPREAGRGTGGGPRAGVAPPRPGRGVAGVSGGCAVARARGPRRRPPSSPWRRGPGRASRRTGRPRAAPAGAVAGQQAGPPPSPVLRWRRPDGSREAGPPAARQAGRRRARAGGLSALVERPGHRVAVVAGTRGQWPTVTLYRQDDLVT